MPSVRSVMIGLGFSALCAVMAQYSINVVHASTLAIDHMPVAAIFLFFVLLLVCHLSIRVLRRPLRLSSEELLLIYVMAFVGCAVSEMGLGCYFLPTIAAPQYYANDQNRWTETILPHLQPWMMPRGREAITGYFEGIPASRPIPLRAWAPALLAWTPFLLALYTVMICMPMMLRRQWVERERLLFPLAQVPIEIARRDDRGFVLFRSRAMWIGFAIPFVVSTIRALHTYTPMVPDVMFRTFVSTFRGTQRLWFYLSFPVIGFIFLTSGEIAFSLWFFALLTMILNGWFNITGISSSENMGVYGSPSVIFNHVGTGALLVFVGYIFWLARFHLRDVWRKAVLNAPIDDSGELLSYRASLFGTLGGILVMVVWLSLAGLPPAGALGFVVLALAIFIGVARVVVEGGVPTLIAPGIAAAQLVSTFGSAFLGPAGLAALGFTFSYAADIRTFVLSAAANSLKIAGEIRTRRRLLFWAVLLSVCVNIVVALGVNLRLGYRSGAINLEPWYAIAGPQVGFNFAKDKIEQSPGPDKAGLVNKAVGGGAMAALLFMRSRFLWWRLHPIGWVVGSCQWIQMLWFSIFLAWLAKTMVMKYGGPPVYAGAKPFFLGLVLGQYVAAALWFVIDFFTGKQFNSVFWI